MKDDIIGALNMDQVTHSIIMVAGVGGAGGNALNHMVDLGINDVTFMACNTDMQALDHSKASIKVQLGEGLGAGNNPVKGREAAKESLDDIIAVLRSEGTKMLFITAGMGGGTGTGASPIIAKAAQELDILTVAIVTTPYTNEGHIRVEQARKGIEELRQYTDSILILNNDSIEEMYGDLPLVEGFWKADDVLATAGKGIAEIITGHGTVNVDFADVNTVMRGSGRALMGSARADGENRAQKVAEQSLTSLLLNNRNITGAKNILLNISYGRQAVTQKEAGTIRDLLQMRTGGTANIIWGTAKKESLGNELEITVVITGFGDNEELPAEQRSIATPQEETPHHATTPFVPTDKPKGVPEREVPEPQVRLKTPTQSSVVQWKGKDRYANIDQLIHTPAWVRNRAKLVNPYDAGRSAGKTSLKEEGTRPEEKPTQQAGSLFDE